MKHVSNQVKACVNKNVIADDGYIEWITVNLSTEPQNNDVVYRLLNLPNGDWVKATGLIEAQNALATIQQNFLTNIGLGSVISWTTWPSKSVN